MIVRLTMPTAAPTAKAWKQREARRCQKLGAQPAQSVDTLVKAAAPTKTGRRPTAVERGIPRR